MLMSYIYFEGVYYDHVELNYSINGQPINEPITGIRGTVFPALFGLYNIYSYTFTIYKKINQIVFNIN